MSDDDLVGSLMIAIPAIALLVVFIRQVFSHGFAAIFATLDFGVLNWSMVAWVVVGMVALYAATWRLSAGGRLNAATKAGMVAHFWTTPGELCEIGRHEMGHAVVAEATGMGVKEIVVYPDGSGGYVRAKRDGTPEQVVAFLSGGHKAIHSKRGASFDLGQIEAVIRAQPRDERAGIRDRGEKLGTKLVNRHRSRINREGDKLGGDAWNTRSRR